MAMPASEPSRIFVVANNKANSYRLMRVNYLTIAVRYGREVLSLKEIKIGIDNFIEHAKKNPTALYYITRVGVGLSRYTDDDIAPMFYDAPINCRLPEEWKGTIPEIEGRTWWKC